MKPPRRNFNNNGQTKIWSKVEGKDNKTGTAKWHNILLHLGFFVGFFFFDLEKIRSWGTRSDMVRREQMDHNVTGDNQIYTSLFVS